MKKVLMVGRGRTRSLTVEEICRILVEKPESPFAPVEPSRADRRRSEKEQEKGSKTLNITVKALDDMLKKAREEERSKVFDFSATYYSAAIALVLHDKWGFGHDRLAKAIGQINEIFDGILGGYVNIDDIRQALLEETKTKI